MKSQFHIITMFWFLVVTLGVGSVFVISFTMGSATIFERAPSGSKLLQENGKAKLILFIDTKCECSRASVEEFRNLTRYRDAVELKIVFMNSRKDDFWLRGRIWDMASNIQEAQIVVDERDREVKLYNVNGTGQAKLYNEFHELVYSGDIAKKQGSETIKRWLKKRAKKAAI